MPQVASSSAPSLFLDLYFPFHYEVGFAVERAMRDARLTQLQNVILWTLHASGEQSQRLPRKHIEARLGPWFEVTSSAMSKAIRAMTQPPLELLTVHEHPQSAREKLVCLTPQGHQAVAAMQQRGERFIARIVAQLEPQEVAEGQRFLRRVSEIVEGF